MSPTDISSDNASERWTALQIRAVLLCLILNMVDGADVLVVSYAAPLLTKTMGLTAETLGLVFGAGLLGMMFGALTIAPLSDLAGRKVMILVALTIVATGMVASSHAENLEQLIGLRFIAGLGIGSMLASVTALASEYAPERSKVLAVTLATGGYPLGATLTGVAANSILPVYGWPGLFLFAGIVSAALLPVCILALPESAEFLSGRQPRNALARLNRIRTAQSLAPLQALPAANWSKTRRPPVGRLFASDFRAGTLLIWSAFFMTFLTLYFLTSWLPRIVTDAGLPLGSGVYAGAIFNLGAFVGLILLSWFARRLPLPRLIAYYLVGGALLMALFAAAGPTGLIFYSGLFVLGFLVQGGFTGLYALVATLYPAEIRTTGVGWALGAGRLGAIAGPVLGGLVIGAGGGIAACFLVFAVPLLLGGLIVRRISVGQRSVQA